MASKHSQLRAALPMPPYTTSSSGRSATSGSRLFISMRSGASVSQDLAVRRGPRGARIGPRAEEGSSVMLHSPHETARTARDPRDHRRAHSVGGGYRRGTELVIGA